jgi:GTP-binding protein
MAPRITSAEFVIGAVGSRDFPTDGRPEIALAGRSNVGKSMLINALLRRDVARTSARPGKTREVNVYRVTPASAGAFYLVDLPGYGHTSGGPRARGEFAAMTDAYFESRLGTGTTKPSGNLVGIVLATDSRHPGLPADVDAVRWAHKRGGPFLVIATKVDKLSQSERATLRRESEQLFGAPVLAVSALRGEGLDGVWKQIFAWLAP